MADGQRIFLAGSFSSVGGVVARNLAVRTSATAAWAPYPADGGLSGGTFDVINAMTSFDAGTGAGPELIVAGQFSSIGGTLASNIARWNGNTWQPLGLGTNAAINAVTTWNDGSGTALYATGSFTQAGGLPCAKVAKWNGTSWSSLGSGLTNGTGTSLIVVGPPLLPTSSLIVGGAFTAAGGTNASMVAAWNGASWAPLINSSGVVLPATEALALYDDGSGLKLYAGGQNGLVGPIWSDGLQRWNGVTWTTVPGWTSVSNSVVAFALFDDGNGQALYFGTKAAFTNTPAKFGRISPAGITSWPVTASAGIAAVHAVVPFDDGDGAGVVLGGHFDGIAGVTFANAARLRSGAISPLGWGVFGMGQILSGSYGGGGTIISNGANTAVRSARVHDDGSGSALFLGGDFSFAGSVASERIAKYEAGPPSLVIGQPYAGMPATIHCMNLQAGREYLNVFSFETSVGAQGQGPWLGLYASDPAFLMAQAALPLGTWPFHFLAPGTEITFGPYPVPPGLAVDAITIDMTGYHLWQVSGVTSKVFE
jgi:hypothetical protein